MRIVLALTAVLALAGCSSGSTGAVAPAPAPTTAAPTSAAPEAPADGGLGGTWSATSDQGTWSVVIGPAVESNPDVVAAEQCRTAMGAAPVVWLTMTVENPTSAPIPAGVPQVVTSDGQQVRAESIVGTLNPWYGPAPDSPARAACSQLNSDQASKQLTQVLPGAKAIGVYSLPGSVTAVKSVSNGLLMLTYNPA